MFRVVFDASTGERVEVPLTPEEVAALPPAPEPSKRYIAKTTIYRRATDAELEKIQVELAKQPLRNRLLWQDAENGVVAVDDVLPFFSAHLPYERAVALLAPG